MSLQNKLRSRFLRAIEAGGIREVKRLIATGRVKRDEPVDLEKELAKAKEQVGTAGDALQITDNDLREVLRRVCKKCSLEVENGSQ